MHTQREANTLGTILKATKTTVGDVVGAPDPREVMAAASRTVLGRLDKVREEGSGLRGAPAGSRGGGGTMVRAGGAPWVIQRSTCTLFHGIKCSLHLLFSPTPLRLLIYPTPLHLLICPLLHAPSPSFTPLQVDAGVIDFFLPSAEKLLSSPMPARVLAAALASMSGFSRVPEPRSLLTSEPGQVTLRLLAKKGRVDGFSSLCKVLRKVRGQSVGG